MGAAGHSRLEAIMEFTKSKNCHVAIPMSQDHGTYTTHGDRLTLKIKVEGEEREETVRYQISGDRLTIVHQAGTEETFIRRK